MDENPLDIKMVVGYEQGYLSSQGSNNNAFLAIYGRKLFGAKKSVPTFGPYFAIRLLTRAANQRQLQRDLCLHQSNRPDFKPRISVPSAPRWICRWGLNGNLPDCRAGAPH